MEFEEIYRLYAPEVYRYALSLCRDPVQAEDLTAETFLRSLRALDAFRGDCRLTTWLCRITRNLYLNRLRKDKRLTFTDEELPTAPSPAPEETVLARQTLREVSALLGELPEAARRVFLLRSLRGLSFREIASHLGKTENWACVTYHRACRQLRKRMEDRHDNPE